MWRKKLPFVLAGLLLVLSASCQVREELDLSVYTKLKGLKWVAYSPTNFNPSKKEYPSQENIKKDLEVLRQAGFEGIVTYGAEYSLKHVPRLAKQTGFDGVIMGVWDIEDEEEIESAVRAREYVDGYCLGNEGYKKRYSLEKVRAAIDKMKESTGKPVTTTEEVDDYYYDQGLIDISDWIFLNIHPVLSNIRNPDQACEWVKMRIRVLRQRLEKKGLNKLIVIKETGFPTHGGWGCSEKKQKEFFELMEKSRLHFFYFEAFDQPWKTHLAVEPYWGLFDSERGPKLFMRSRLTALEAKGNK